MKHAAKLLLVILIFHSNLITILAQDSTDATKVQQWHFSRVSRTHSRTRGRLPVGLRHLQQRSQSPIDVVIGPNDSVISADVDVPIGTGSASTSISIEQSARKFLRAQLTSLSPHVAESELRQKNMPYDCQVAPTFRGRPGKILIFERLIQGRTVIGSSLTLRIDGDGRILNVINSMAPISNRVVNENASQFQAIPSITLSKRKLLSQLITDVREREAVVRNGKPVLVPVRAGTGQGMVKAKHITWTNSSGELGSGFLLDDQTVLAPTMVPATKNDKSIPLAHIDGRTNLPSFISYQPRGGLPVSAVGVFDNPAEIAFRYLEEHREVFRTGSPRCQFEIVDIRKSTFNPRVSFVKLGQLMAGRRVFGAELVFEIEDGHRVQTIQGHTIAHLIRLDAQISPQTAQARALQQQEAALASFPASVSNQIRQKPFTSELVVFPGELVTQQGMSKDPPTRLAYHTRSFLQGLFVDAISGDVLYGYSLSHSARVIREAGGLTILQKPMFRQVVNNEVLISPGTPLSVDAAAAVPLVLGTSNFYAAHGWAGTDGSGSNMIANVNVNLFTCPNAFSPPIDEESYFCTGEVVGDIVAHELTHGVVWNSSNLVYADEPGALNESFADIMGNLAFPDLIPLGSPPGTIPGWLLGEAVAGATSVRNMANPALSTPVAQPGNYAGYLSRNALGCSPLDIAGALCDFGGVHINSGINSRAYVLISDGGLGPLVGMGRAKTRMIAFDVMALRLSAWSNLIDSAIATKASCDAALTSGLTDLTGAPFTQLDCDQMPGSFAAVGLDRDLITGWIPPTVAFRGITLQYPGETTVNGCIITDLTLQMRTPAGLIDSKASVVPGGAPLFVSYFGFITATIAVTTPPIGGMLKTHPISWTSAYGETPEVRSFLSAPTIVQGNSNCRGDFVTETKTSVSAVSDGIPWVGGSGTTTTGFFFSTMNPACVLVRTQVELVNGSGSSIASPGLTSTWSDVVWVTFVKVTLSRTATITSQPPGNTSASFDLSAPVAWTYSSGVESTRWRLVYTVDKPPGVTCTP